MNTHPWLLSALAAVCLASAASAQTQFVDQYEGYSVGSVINGQGGWKQWQNAPNASSIIEDSSTGFARSGHSVSVNAILGGDTSDLVHEFTGFTAGTGRHTIRAYTYSATGSVDKWFFLLMSRYTDVGPFAWGAQLTMDPVTALWTADHGGATPTTGPLILDAWVEVRADIDLTANTGQVFYNGAPTAAPYCWSCGVFGGAANPLAQQIAAVDLYHNPASTNPSGKAYWDDFSLVSAAVPYCTAKVNSQGCTPAMASIGTASAYAGSGFNVTCTNLLNNKPTMLVYTNGGRAATPFFGGTLCIAGPIRRGLTSSSGGTAAPAVDCTGTYSVDINAYGSGSLGATPAAFLGVPGTVVNAQTWARDPGFAAPNNASLSNALEWTTGT